MQRRNGQVLNVRLGAAEKATEFLGRHTCRECGCLVPRGTQRSYCLDHSPYARRVLQELQQLEERKAA